ncbi:LOW QUALITY PROTEIN: hypothetical protein BSKO_10803 [Bryopsis sp. KO-2023]|nr:LOW QUALITY PROTEIN: hypothetical protein BSKO_10803 [Bryopsis sp. KO-2023]
MPKWEPIKILAILTLFQRTASGTTNIVFLWWFVEFDLVLHTAESRAILLEVYSTSWCRERPAFLFGRTVSHRFTWFRVIMRCRMEGVGASPSVSVFRRGDAFPSRKDFWKQDLGRTRRDGPVCRAIRLFGSSNGAEPVGESVEQELEESRTTHTFYNEDEDCIEMFVADVDFLNPSEDETVMFVPDPKAGMHEIVAPTERQHIQHGRSSGDKNSSDLVPSTARALRIESAWSANELKNKNRELVKAKMDIRMRDKEIADLKRRMAERDQSLRYSKAELIESRRIIQKKDEQLRQTYDSLVISARERSKLREELINVEKELMDARDELHHWTTQLVDLKTVIDSVDEEDGDLEGIDMHVDGSTLPIKETTTFSQPIERTQDLVSAVDLLGELKDLSHQLMTDAKEDEKNLRPPEY